VASPYEVCGVLTSQLQRGHPPQLAAAWSTQLTGGGRANTWDSQNRLRTCVTAQHTSAFTYGADGLRRQTVLDGQATTQYTLDSSMVIRENTTGGVNAGQVTYLCGPRGPEYRRTGLGQNAQVTWYCYDGLGSVLAEASSTGYITGARQMDVYGAPRATQGSPTTKHAYVGSLGHPTEDDAGLIYMRARWMDPVTGTFVSEDEGRQGRNWMCYSACAPTVRGDFTGQGGVTDPAWDLLSQALLEWFTGLATITDRFVQSLSGRLQSINSLNQFGKIVQLSRILDWAKRFPGLKVPSLPKELVPIGSMASNITTVAQVYAAIQWTALVGCDIAFEEGR
jgi:RHS repeat-associated protein